MNPARTAAETASPVLLEGSCPILSCERAAAWEKHRLEENEANEWRAMEQAGKSIAREIQRDFREIGEFPSHACILVLVGKGNNGGDALIATAEILRQVPGARAEVLFVFGERSLRPLARKAWQEGWPEKPDQRVQVISADALAGGYDLCLDGVFGFSFRPPADPRVSKLISGVNALPVRLRAAVDLPSADIFRADFTYATGAVKLPVVGAANAGRVRYLDLGFFPADDQPDAEARVLTSRMLQPLAALRPAAGDKRTYGHLFVLGGSRGYPGAVLMATLAAVRSGVGLVTAFVPESLVPAYAARVPEAMWVGWPETPEGSLALEGRYLLTERLERATAMLIGPGLGRERETQALVRELVGTVKLPVALDADALQPEIVQAAKTSLVLTPHAGEFARIAKKTPLDRFAVETGTTVILKGPVTRVASGAGATRRKKLPVIYHSFFGGPVLARGGSGDLLGGLCAGLLAQHPAEPLHAAAQGVVWHGVAADHLARSQGQTAVHTTQLLDFLPAALRDI